MYLYHFGLRELPFTLTPNTSFYCDLQVHNEALDVLLTALKTGEGFIKVTGEVGTGKTLLCRKLLNEIPDHFVTAYIPNPYLSPAELRQAIAVELGIKGVDNFDQHKLTQALENELLRINKLGRSVVILLDEAQALPQESLEALRLFSNIETETRKLVHLVLFGQPELDERLATRELRQLRQRISFSYRLSTLSEEEFGRYLHHRLQVAGYRGPPMFTPRLTHLVHKASRGVPRLANVISHKALLSAYGAGRFYLERNDIIAAVKDTEDANSLGYSPWVWTTTGIVIGVLLVATLAYGLGWVNL
ncbi:ExeA family protein [Aliidiomarina quisquiliarum]|uniref:ExeA family protein n=1 Tax=Aliidiomarina quisquiliarum TaxID=2938947 RepID=UPI00208F14A0|nr:AAA family ATPase [Aliidiomarina quisquiliarum]MCO4322483.1 AAA family ATPase [Aliidiomarina quisquiliarum]